jgi:hypothetical protein
LNREFADENNKLKEGDMVFISKIVDDTCHVELPDGSCITLPSSELFSKQQFEELINDKVNLAFSKVLKGTHNRNIYFFYYNRNIFFSSMNLGG